MLSLPVLESFNTYDNPCSWSRVRCQTFSWVLSTPRHCNHQPRTLFVTHSFVFSTHNWILQNLSMFKQWYSSQWNEFLRIIKLINLLWKKIPLCLEPLFNRYMICIPCSSLPVTMGWIPEIRRACFIACVQIFRCMCDQTFWLSRHMSG